MSLMGLSNAVEHAAVYVLAGGTEGHAVRILLDSQMWLAGKYGEGNISF